MNWQRKLATILYPEVFEEIDSKRNLIYELTKSKEAFRQRINTLESANDDLRYDNIDLKRKCLKPPLNEFKTNRLYKPRAGKSFKLSTWLNNIEERAHVADWVDENLDLSLLEGTIDDQAKQLRYMIYDHFGSKDIWKADKVQNTFSKPSELIAHKFKGNCNDWFVFIYYVYDYAFGEDNRLYCAMGGLCLPEGWNQGNHAYCLWHHTNGEYYVIESAIGRTKPWNTYIQASLDAFGSIKHQHNKRYGNIVWLANRHQTYYQVKLC